MFNRKITYITACIGISLGVVLVSAVCGNWWPQFSSPRTFKYVLKDDPPLTEKLAIELTKRTMQKTLKKGEKLELQRYNHKKTNYFARNSINPNSGYVRWDKVMKGRKKAHHYMVHVDKKGKEFFCSYGRMQ